MTNNQFDFGQLEPQQRRLARKKASPWPAVALVATGLVACAAAWWLLRNAADSPLSEQKHAKAGKAEGPGKNVSDVAESQPASSDSAPLEIDPIDDLTIDDDRPVQCTARIKSAGDMTGLHFSLAAPAPRGARIDPKSGEFHWKPAAIEPGDYPITIVARRSGNKADAKQSFTVHVVSTDPPLERLVSELSETANREKVEVLPEDFFSPFGKYLSATSRIVRIGDEQIVTFVYETPEEALTAEIAPDLSKIAGEERRWTSPATCFRRGRLIALYVGNDPGVRQLLQDQLGAPLAECTSVEKPTRVVSIGDRQSSSDMSPAAPAEKHETPSIDESGQIDALAALYQDKKLFVKKEYPALRQIFARQFERDQQSKIAAGLGDKSDEILAWLEDHVDFKEELFTALDPAYDDVEAALRLVRQMKEAFPSKIDSYGNLAIALAVTWDKPQHVYDYTWHARRCEASLPDGTLSALDNFQYLVEAESVMQGRAQFLPWEFLVHLVNHKTPRDEREWAVSNYLPQRMMYGKCYSDVPYDHDLLDHGGVAAHLRGHPYTLANLRQYGGVCAMQADYAARVGQSMGVPAAYVTGEANSGALHAWVVWVELKAVNKTAINFTIESHGRYRDDQYYVGHFNDPRTGEHITDRDLELRLHSVGVNPQHQRHARLAMRAFPLVRDKLSMDAAEQLRYLAQATGLCPWNEDAWYALGEMARSGAVGKPQSKAMASAVDRLFTTFASFPDFTWKVFDSLIAFPKEHKHRNGLYERLVALYEQAGRPDLACEARLKLSDYQAEDGRGGEAIEGLAFTIKKFPGEGRYVPRMLDKIELLAKDVKGANEQVVQFYQEFLPLVPAKRGDTLTDYCVKMYERGIDRFKEAGQPALAQLWTTRLAQLKFGFK